MLPAHLAHGSETLSRLGSGDLVLSAAAGLLAVAVTLSAPASGARRDRASRDPTSPHRAWGFVGVAVLVVAVVASRVGRPLEPDNLASLLLPYLLLPALIVLSAAAEVWAPTDPWRLLGAGVDRLAGDPRDADRADPRWAVLAATGWTIFAARYSSAVDPRALGTALEIYTFVTLAGCAVFGSRRWLARGEVFGVVFDLLARIRAGARLPPGAAMPLAVVVVGAVFFRVGGLRATHALLGETTGQAHAAALVAATALAAAAAARALDAWNRRAGGVSDAIACALAPGAAALIVAVLLRRSLVAGQLLPRVLSDPFGQGWRLFDPPRSGVDAMPLGDTTQQALAAGVLLAGVVTGSLLAAHGPRLSAARTPAAVAVGTLAAVGTLVVLGT